MLLLQETEHALADKSSPKVIFLHMMGSHPNPCDRLHSWPNHYRSSIPEKLPVTSPASVNWITFSVSLMVSFAGIPVILPCFTFLTMGCRSATVLILFIMMVMCRGLQRSLIITASDITSHQSVSRKISARHFAGIFQWLTGIRTENILPFNPLTDEDNEPVMVFNGEKNVPADSLKPQPLILPDHR